MSPLAGVPILFLSFPGVLPLRGATAGLLYAAPYGAQKFRSLTRAICPLNSDFVLCFSLCPRVRAYRLTRITAFQCPLSAAAL